MKLSDFSFDAEIVRDINFLRLGYADLEEDGLLAYADSLKFVLKAVSNPSLTALITTPELAHMVPKAVGLLTSDNPRSVFYKIHERFIDEGLYKLPFTSGVGTGCDIHPTAVISPGCRIGDNVKIAEHVIIRDSAWIGSNVTIEPGVKLGMEGILYAKGECGFSLIRHAGYVRIHDDATLMTNSVVVRSVHDTDFTKVGSGSLIGLSTIIGHEAKVGSNVVISNQCVVARRSVIGDNAFLGTQVMIKENVRVGHDARVMTGSVVIENVPNRRTVSGNFATDHRGRMLDFLRSSNKRIL